MRGSTAPGRDQVHEQFSNTQHRLSMNAYRVLCCQKACSATGSTPALQGQRCSIDIAIAKCITRRGQSVVEVLPRKVAMRAYNNAGISRAKKGLSVTRCLCNGTSATALLLAYWPSLQKHVKNSQAIVINRCCLLLRNVHMSSALPHERSSPVERRGRGKSSCNFRDARLEHCVVLRIQAMGMPKGSLNDIWIILGSLRNSCDRSWHVLR